MPSFDPITPTDRSTHPFTIYFAGALFNHKELTGNAMLAKAIEKVSQGRYLCILPQDLEPTAERAAEVRNQDLLHVMSCDMAIFNFDGAELDSGTVVEMIFAKMLDIPSVVLRTDFRSGGDFTDGDPWNLMCSAYPRNKVVLIHGMAWYQEAVQKGGTPQDIEERYHLRIATQVVEALDVARSEKSWYSDDINVHQVYRCALRFPGAGLEKTPSSLLRSVIRRKTAKGLLPAVSEMIPHKAEQLHATFTQLQKLARDLHDSDHAVGEQILSVSTIERCHSLLQEVLEVDRFYGDSLEMHCQLFNGDRAGGEMRSAMETSINTRCTEIQAKAETLFREVSYSHRAMYSQPQVVVGESLLRTFTLEVQRVAGAIVDNAAAPRALA